ncbi:PKD-like domain-containing protein [Flavobacterium sp. 7A]|uniref:HYR-like domain-containing protein n=1 Tax=Flavobacterium sp. 7A TaxID=2940571 RepID=UPI002225BAF0|nr:PKD-like domain-containing protein [Flavobacterium sp. 7A]MCW2119579.1 putative repeat protein (TIGR01451 family)/gliding motility-associated-like protein [Flavobacterium sp. 7A]
MIKKYLYIFFISILTSHATYSQLSDLHYLPPLKQSSNRQAVVQQAFYLSTPEATPFTVQVFQGTGTTAVATLTVSNGSPVKYDLADGDNNITLVTNVNTGERLTNSGLRFVAASGKKFYVNYRGRSGAQATSLTSKGRQALGKEFKWGGIPNRANNASLTNTLGIMATTNGTVVTIKGYDPNCVFRKGNTRGAITDDILTINLDAGESFVLEASPNEAEANRDGWLGASISATQNIAISNGGLNVGIRAGSGSRDAAIDQPVPQNIVGRDYVFVRGNGTDETEFPIIIGTQNGTDIFVNGSSTPIATINNGEYFEIPGSNYSSGNIGANMTVITSKEAYAYQCLAGSSGIQTIGLNFIAPVNCLLPDNLSNIPDIRDVANLNFTGGITILASTSTPNSNITVTDGSGVVALPAPTNAAGLPWKSFFVSNLTGNVSVQSTGPIAVGFIGVNNNAGIAGYFSGFDTVPVVDLEITGGGCLPGSDLKELSGSFDAYQWFKDNTIIPGATSNIYTPSTPGDFFVRVTKGGCTYDSSILSAYNCDPEIILTKTVDKSNVLEGDTVIFKVSVKSLGVNPVTNLVINDLLPAELSFVSATAVHGTWTAPNWNIGTMTSGEVFTIFITAKVNEVTASSTVINTVSNTEDIPEADVQVDDDTEPINITNSEIDVTKTSLAAADGSYDTVGEIINYTIVVKNTGDTNLTNITLTDPKADTGSISPSSVATLAIGASTTFTATHTITQADIEAGQVVNQATAKATLSNGYVISDVSDDPTNATSTTNDPTVTPIIQKGKLVLEKIAQPAADGLYDNLGEKINYEIRVINTGNVSLNNITVTDPNADTGTILPAVLANLPAGESAVFSAKHTIVQADFNVGKVSNIATVTGTEPVGGATITDQSDDPTTAAQNDATVVSVPEIGRLEVTKRDAAPADGSFDTVGEIITYTIFVKNTGTVTLKNLNIIDSNATGIILESTTGVDGDTSDKFVDEIDPGETATFIATHVIKQIDLDNGKVQNTATAGAQDPGLGSVTDLSDDPDNPNNAIDDPTITLMTAKPSLIITKAVNDELNVAAGQNLTYTYVVTNNGNITIDNVSISDIHVANGTLSLPAIQSTTGTDNDTSNNKIEILAPGQTAMWTATYLVNQNDINNQQDITNTVTATGTPRNTSVALTNPTAAKTVTVHPIETICSNAVLNHDLTTDGPFSGASFSWVAVANDEITGISTTAKTTSVINDAPTNQSTFDQIVQYNITVKNAAGITIDTYKFLVTIHPELEVPENDKITVQCASEIVEPDAPIVLDYQGASVTPVITSSVTGDQTCEGSKTYKFEYTDCGNNVSTYTYTYIIDRTTAPATIPADGASTVECIANATTPTPPTGIKDVCGTDVTAVLASTVDSPATLSCEGTRTYNYTYTDCSGLVSNWKYTYTIDHTIAPASIPADGASTVECIANATTPTPPTGIKDVCGTDVTAVLASTVDSPATLTCEGSRTYNYTYTDCSGLVSNWKYTYTIDHTIAPATIPADGASTVECIANATTPTPPTGIKDVCETDVTAVLASTVDSPATLSCEGTRTYNYTYTDCSGLVSNWKYTYTIDHTIAPATITADGASTVECIANATTPTPPTGIKDVCGTDVTAVLASTVDSPATLSCEGSRTYNYTYTDCSGLVSNWKYTYTIDHTIAPATIPADGASTVECIANATTPTPPTGIKDVCGTDVTAVLASTVDSPTTLSCEGSRTYNYTYTDCSGLVSNWKYTYTIDHTIAPATIPADGASTVECIANATTPTPPTGIKDVCGTDVIAFLDSTVDSPATLSCEGSRTYNYTYTDCSGLVSNWKYTYTIDHTIAPATIPADGASTVECIANATTPTPPTGIKDVCGTDVTAVLASTVDSPATLSCEGSITYNYTYTDCSGLVSTWKYTYTIDHTIAPATIPTDGASTVECIANATTPTPPTGIKDVCGTDVTAVLASTVDSPATVSCEGSRTYNYTYTDCSGLVSNWKYTYTIDHTIAPATIPADGASTVECIANATTPTPPTGIKDVCGTDITAVLASTVDSPATVSCEGSRTYNYTYTDCSGLVSNWKYTYTIDHTIAPATIPADGASTVECIANATTPTPPTGIKDVCGTDVTAVLASTVDSPATVSCEGSRTYNYTYTDCSGLVSNWKYTYTIDHTIAPATIPADGASTVECIANATTPTPPTGIKDVCGTDVTAVLASTVDSPATLSCEGSRTYNYTYTDCSGLVSNWKYTYTIDHTIAPATIPADGASTVECIANATTPTPPTGIKDVCGTDVTAVLASTVDSPATLSCEGSRTYNYTYTDCSGLVSNWKYTYTIDHTTAPATIPANGASTVECIANATTPTPPTGIKDICGTDVTAVLASTVDSPTTLTCEGSRTYNYTYTDCSGLVSNWKYTYTIDLTSKPTVPANANSTVECLADAVQPAAPPVTDKCGNNITPVITASANPVCEGTKVYTYTYTDCASNVSVYTYTYTLDLTSKPVVPANASSTVECLADAVQPVAPVVTDKCGNTITPVITASADPVCEGTKVYTYTYTDCASNVSVYTYTYTLDLTSKPTVPANASSTVECLADAVQPTAPVVTDKCGNALTPVITASADPVCEGTKMYTYTYTDCASNLSVYTYTYTLDLITKPIVPANASSTVECLADAVQPTAPVVTDKCGNNITPVITAAADPVCEGTKVYTYTYTDCASNVSVYTYTYTLDLTTKPVVPANAGSTVECLADAVQPVAPVVTDKCGNNITPVITAAADPVCEGTKVYTYTYTDCASNVSVYTYTYTLDLTSKPTVPVNASSTVECLADAVQPVAPAVTDKCGNALTPVITASADPVCEGTKVYTYTYTDCASNVSVYTYTYTLDLTSKPTVPVNASSTVECLADAVQPVAPVVTDKCGNNITPVITASADPVCEGTKVYTYTYTDCASNVSVYTYTYTLDLTSKPTVPVNASSTVECLADAVQPAAPVVTDKCGNNITPVITASADPVCEGTKVYTYTYTDCASNVSVYTYTYTLDLTSKPVVPVNASSTVECLADAVQPAAPPVTDKCGNALTPVITASADPVCEGTKVYTYTYTDCASNVSVYTFTYTLDLTTKPTVPANASSTVECLANAVQPVAPVVTDKCGNNITPVITASADPVCEGTKVYTYTYTDCASNVSVYTYTYTLDLTSKPTVPVNASSTVECLADAVQPVAPVVTDKCGNNITPVINASADPVCEGTKVYTYTYTDCASNVSVYTYTYTIDMTIKPIVSSNGSALVNDISKAVQPTAPTVIDNCGKNIVPVITENVSPVCDGQKIYYFTYTDCGGNSSVYTYTYTIDVTSTLIISNKTKISCSDVALNYDLKTTTPLVNPTFTWVATDNPAVTGEKNGNGTTITDAILNISGVTQTVKYTVTPFNNKGCQGPTFELLVTVKPQPFASKNPTDVTCSNIALNHNLSADVDLANTTFTWAAANNPNVSGETTTSSISNTIKDKLVNTSGVVQTVVYTITPESSGNCTGKPFTYTVTVRPEATLVVTKITLPATDGQYDSVGEIVKYQITVENKNELTVSNLTLEDLNADASSISPSSFATVAAFQKVMFTASHTITQSDLNAGQVVNSAIGSAFDPCGTRVSDLSDDPSTTTPNDNTITSLVQKPVLALEKTFTFNDENGDGLVQNKETITYNFKVTNTGNVTLTNISINDPLMTVNGGPISLAPTAVDATTFAGTYVITQGTIDSGSLTNSATVTGTDPKGKIVTDISDDPKNAANTDTNGNGNPDDSTIFAIVAKPELTVEKTGVFIDANGDGLAQVGETVSYSFEIKNTGNVTITGITVNDPFSPVTGGPITLLPGAKDITTFTTVHTLTQAEINTGTVTNSATAAGKAPNGATISDVSDDPTTAAQNDATVTKLTQNPLLTLLKTAVFNDENGNGFPETGETVSYSFTVKNNGNVTLTGITISDPLTTVTAGPITLAPNKSDATTFKANYTLKLTDINAGQVTNTAKATGKDPDGKTVATLSDDPNNATNGDSDNDGHPDDPTLTKLAPNAKLSVTKTGVFKDANNDGLAQVGETIDYTFEVSNIGNVSVSGIKISDPLVTVTGGPISLDPNQKNGTTFKATYTLTQADIDAAKVTNVAVASGQTPKGVTVSDTSDDPNNPTNTDNNGNGEPDDATITTIPGKGKVSLTKVTLAPTDGSYDSVGEKINYLLTITNTGNLTLSNLAITDANADTGSILPAIIATLAPGKSATVSAAHSITQSEIDLGSVTNSASVTATDTAGNTATDTSDDPNNATNADTNGDGDPDDATVTSITQKPAISLEKTFVFNDENGDGFPQLNESITYNFKVQNTGKVTLSDIKVIDPLVTVLGGPITLAPTEIDNHTFYATYKITQANIDAGFVSNSAVVNSKDTNGNTVTDTSDDPNNSSNVDANGDGEPDDATITALVSKPQLTVTKIGSFIDANQDGLAQVGETIRYHFEISNTGNVTISNITIADALVAVTGNPITLAPKAKNTTNFVAIYTLTQDDVNTGFVINTATASGQDPFGGIVSDRSDDPTTAAKNDDTNTSLAREPQLSLFKTATFNDENGDGLPQANETIRYNFDIRNNGNVTIFGIQITDPLVAITGAPLDLQPTEGNDTHFSALYTIKQSDIDSGGITNSALAVGQDKDGSKVTDVSDFSDDPDNPNDEDLNGDGDPDDPTVTALTGKAALNITKTATFNDTNNNGFTNVGETITYAFAVSNIGNLSLTNVKVTDPIVTVSGATISLLPGQLDATTFKAVYNITQEDLDTGKVSNTAVASGQDPNGIVVKDFSDDPNNTANADLNNDGNPDDATITSFPVQGKISILKTALAAADGAYDTIGEKITYSIVVTNSGSTTLSNIKITDTNADLGTVVPSAISVLSPGKSVTITAIHTVTQADLNAGFVSNTAAVRSNDALGNVVSDLSDDPTNPANIDTNADGDPDDATISAMAQKPQLQLTKASTLAPDGLWDTIGEVILYNLVLTNTGNVTLTNVAVTDANADAGSVTPANFATLLPGQKVTLTAKHTITQVDLDKGAVTNTAVATAKDPKGGNVTDDSDDPNNDTNKDTNGDGEPDDATVTVTPQLAILEVTKVTNNRTFTKVGDPILYTIVVTNRGNINLLNVNVRDNNGTFTSQSSVNVLAPGKSFTVTATHLTTADDILFGYIDNTAVVHALIPNSTTTIEEDSDDPTNTTNVDIDKDGDFEDPTTSYLDTDSDGVADIIDIDDDNDGILDTVEGTMDSDGDGISNHLDIDADNDGIPDNLEAQTTTGYKAPSKIDLNKNGLDDAYENGTVLGLTPTNTDGTDNPDYLDTDSDNDGVADIIEAFDKNKDGIPDLFISGNDADHDGLDDSFEGANTMDGFVVNDEFKNGSRDTHNTDGTDEPDYRDIDDDNDGVYTKYELDPNGDGNGPDDTDKDGIPDYLDTDDDGDGISTKSEGADPNGDGNPNDAVDGNANGIPDYLEVGNYNLTLPADEIEVFSAVSPNGDGDNDVLVLGRIYEFPENTVQIYNRWGVLVYETVGYGSHGNFFRGYSEGRVTVSKSNKLPSATYFYIIKYRSNGINKQKAGYLYLQY